MKTSTVLAVLGAASTVVAWPGMEKVQSDLKQRLAARQEATDPAGDAPGVFDSNELIGDLATVGPTTQVGQDVANIIVAQTEEGFSDVTYNTTIPALGTAACAADTCCVWHYIVANELVPAFSGTSGRCNGLARAAVRQGFHDAGAWNKESTNGGADGSLILADEITRSENNGLQEIINFTTALFNKYKQYGISIADLIQIEATTATVVCPLGPRIRTFIGRPDSSLPSPTG
jgi:hypothetical protein